MEVTDQVYALMLKNMVIITMIIQVTNFLSCVRSDHSKDELQSSLQWSFKLQIFSCV